MLSVIFLLLITTWGLYFLKFCVPEERRKLLKMAAQVPTYKGAVPFIGHAYKLIGGNKELWKTFKKVSKAAEDAGGVLTAWVGPGLVTFINDPDDALTVLNSCLGKMWVYKKVGPNWVANGLFSADVATWKRNRKLLNPTFSQHVLEGYIHVFNEQAALLVQDLEPLVSAGEFDPKPYLKKRVLEALCRTAIGISLDDESVIDQRYAWALKTVFDALAYRMGSFWAYIDFLYELTAMRKKEEDAKAILVNTSRRVLLKKKAERQQTKQANALSSRFIATLDLLLDMEENGLITEDQIQQELDTIIAAGSDTSVETLTTILVFIGSYPEVQEKMYNEIMAVLGSSTELSKEDVPKLVYTEAVLKEAHRLGNVVPVIARDVDKDVKLKNYTLPAGSSCVVSLWGMSRLPAWGPDRLEFRPERWLDPASLPQSPGAFGAFSLGKRNCIGRMYATISEKTLLVHFLRKFRVTADYSKIEYEYSILLKNAAGYHISVELRK